MPSTSTISPVKANRLFWLGRYAERVYISLHLLRRYHDLIIDGDPQDYEVYFHSIGMVTTYPDLESAKTGCMYDRSNTNSILCGIEYANDNAIVLREEIKTETLSYIQMSLEHIRRESERNGSNITDLQCVTDWMLAFWGSVEERVWDEPVKFFLQLGKLIEHIDMNIRFQYQLYRIREAFEILKKVVLLDPRCIDMEALESLDKLFSEDLYRPSEVYYRNKVLGLLGRIVNV